LLPRINKIPRVHFTTGGDPGKPFANSAWFFGGHFLVWMAFAAAATLAQWALERAALLAPLMEGTSRILGGALLIASGRGHPFGRTAPQDAGHNPGWHRLYPFEIQCCIVRLWRDHDEAAARGIIVRQAGRLSNLN
jgi:hypothetical protein